VAVHHNPSGIFVKLCVELVSTCVTVQDN